jgi:outer membrane protein OmpA-like peptidoglycan-associated protein
MKIIKDYIVKHPQPEEPFAKGLNVFNLRCVPTPTMVSSNRTHIAIEFIRQVDKEPCSLKLTFALQKDNLFQIYDVNFEHPVSYKIQTDAGELVDKRVLMRDNQRNGEINWLALPQIGTGESVDEHDDEHVLGLQLIVNAILKVDTLTPTTQPFLSDEVKSKFTRSGRFEVTGQPRFGFDGYRLSVALVTQEGLANLATTIDTNNGKLAALIRLGFDDARFTQLVAAQSLTAAEIDFGGTFRITIDQANLDKIVESSDQANEDKILGWLWVLAGPDLVVGFLPDTAPSAKTPDAVIFLPSNLTALPADALPQDVTEAALLARPDLFSDDPGTTCRPFSSPSRILGEKRFRTVLRVTQPRVFGTSVPIRFEDQQTQRVDYPRLGVDANNMIDYEADPSRFQAQSVAIGHVLEQAVRYRSNGYSLGNVAHSLTLAPRQKRRIMKVDFSRKERASRREESSIDDSVSDSVDSRHDYDNAVSGELGEWSRGSSTASANGFAAGAGGVIPGTPIVIGGGVTGGSSASGSTQESHRETAARETQQLRDSIRRHGESLRNFESTVVTESEQSENVTGVSEVVQNINYTRALSIVYYEILRHLRVDTEIAAVSECLFVPLPILPFTDARISRYRKTLSRFARSAQEKAVFRYLDDIQDEFVDSTIPSGERADQPLIELSGSIWVTMGINMPAPESILDRFDTVDPIGIKRELIRLQEQCWHPFAALLPTPTCMLAESLLEADSHASEVLFRTKIAPAMARTFLEHLTLEIPRAKSSLSEAKNLIKLKTAIQANNADDALAVIKIMGEEEAIRSIRRSGPRGSHQLSVDFTPVTAYQRGHSIKIDFTVALDGSLTRRDLEHLILRVEEGNALPKGSYLNLTRAQIDFATDHYRGSLATGRRTSDLLDTETGKPDDSGAAITFLLNDADKLNMRERLKKDYIELHKTLEANTFRYHKAIWRNLDLDELYALLDGYAISDTDGRSLASMIAHKPMGILGNSLIFATRSENPIDARFKTFSDLKAHYVAGLPPADPMRISLPTSGLYARAHMDECIATEEHNGSFDWVFNNQEPELADFPSDMFNSRRAEPQNLMPTPMPASIINLQNAPAAPAPSGFGDAFTALSNGAAFRDATGLAGTQANLSAAMTQASQLATSFGGQAVGLKHAQIQADYNAGRDLLSFGAATQKLVREGAMSTDTAKESLAAMANRQSEGIKTGPSSTNEIVTSAADAIGDSGSATIVADGKTIDLKKDLAPPKRKDPVTDVFVVVIPESNQILFMNFETGSHELRKEHVRALEMLVGEHGLKLDGKVKVEGHASKAGSVESNMNLGKERADALFNKLYALLHPLNPQAKNVYDYTSSTGEEGSYRSKFPGVKKIQDVVGAGDINDPVEKAVLFTFAPNTPIVAKPVTQRCGSKEITITNNSIYVDNLIINLESNGDLTLIDSSSNQEITTINKGNSNNQGIIDSFNSTVKKFFSDFKVEVKGNLIEFGDLLSDINININIGNGSFNKEATPSSGVAEQKHTKWVLKFDGPELKSPRTLLSVIKDTAQLIISASNDGLLSTSNGGTSIFDRIIAEFTDVEADLIKVIMKELGLDTIANLLEMVRFGNVSVGAEIKVEADMNVKVEGTFSGLGMIIGTSGSTPEAYILNNAKYTTSEKMSINEWDDQGGFKNFSYVNNGVIGSNQAFINGMTELSKGLTLMIEEIIPILPVTGVVDSISGFLNDAIAGIGKLALQQTTLSFKAFEKDDGIAISGGDAFATGLELQVISMDTDKIGFRPKKP